ncbi:DUF4395 domain-containing protein [Polluticaenibacter yanchengensis]|uniref:DUF4395 domain-containing protein n=1 Tax=Polluticaenibacter yanchengensis TaxID=3014562 RepID=A0ABT4UK95_9BACT|nr:DUF4395 domain-containing protein [Chitinophagaceae bacterium LY-5]
MTNAKNLYKDSNVIRLVAAQVLVLTVILLLFQSRLIAAFLVADFAIRAFTNALSPLAFIGKTILRKANVKPKQVFAPPKKFAALLGFSFSILILVLLLFNAMTAVIIVAGLLMVAAFLEAVFNICLGCYAYSYLVVPFIKQ